MSKWYVRTFPLSLSPPVFHALSRLFLFFVYVNFLFFPVPTTYLSLFPQQQGEASLAYLGSLFPPSNVTTGANTPRPMTAASSVTSEPPHMRDSSLSPSPTYRENQRDRPTNGSDHDSDSSGHLDVPSSLQHDIADATEEEQKNRTDGFHPNEGEPFVIPADSPLKDVGQIRTLVPGEVLFREDDEALTFHIILEGQLCVLRGSEADDVTHLYPGYVVGAMSFFSGTERGETIEALGTARVLQFSRRGYETLVHKSPECLLPIARAVARQYSHVLRQFFQLGLQMQWFHSGQKIFAEGDAANSLYVIISGRVRALTQSNALSSDETFSWTENSKERRARESPSAQKGKKSHFFFEVGRGETLGEASILLGGSSSASVGSKSPTQGSSSRPSRMFVPPSTSNRSYTAVCVRDTRVVRISRGAFSYIIRKYSSVLMKFAQMMAKRLQQVNLLTSKSSSRSSKSVATIAVVPVGDPSQYGNGVSAFTLRLAAALDRLGPTLHLNAIRFDALHGAGASSRLHTFFDAEKASQWITEKEEENRFIVFEADTGSDITAWTRICVRHADCILLVGRANYDHRVSQLEHDLIWSRTCGFDVDLDGVSDLRPSSPAPSNGTTPSLHLFNNTSVAAAHHPGYTDPMDSFLECADLDIGRPKHLGEFLSLFSVSFSSVLVCVSLVTFFILFIFRLVIYFASMLFCNL